MIAASRASDLPSPRPRLRAECEANRLGYVLAIGCDRRIQTDSGPIRADELATGLPRRAWHRLSAGPGAKGQRFYDWAWIDHTDRPHRTIRSTPSSGHC